MKPSRIDQLMAGYADGDAISREAFLLRGLFRQWGFASDIFAPLQNVSPALRSDVKPIESYRPALHDICFHHYGIASPAGDAFASLRCRRILIYHNITPSRYFRGYDDAMVERLESARRRLMDIAKTCEAVWAVSQFNAEELKSAGISNVDVLPLPFDRATVDIAPQPEVLQQFATPQKTLLFVGRLAPNKKVEDLIHAFAWYTRSLNPYSRLEIVGSARGTPRYFSYLKMLVSDYDLANVTFEGFASPSGLVAYYRSANLYVSTSEHEGYGLPLVEAMVHGIPVVARAVGGVPEATGQAGVLYEDLSAPELACLFHQILTDSSLREEVLASQRVRVEEVLRRDLGREVRELLARFIDR